MSSKKLVSTEDMVLKFKEYNLEIIEVPENMVQYTYVYAVDLDGYIHRTNYISLKRNNGRERAHITHSKNIYTRNNIELFLVKNNRSAELLSMWYGEDNRLVIELKCLRCNHIFSLKWGSVAHGTGCNKCAGRFVDNTNSLFVTRPDLVKYFKNPEDAHALLAGSNKRIVMVCPHCGHEKNGIVNMLSRHGFTCPVCSDGVSMPEKIIYNILEYLNIDFQPQKMFTWSGKKRYDFYIPSLNIIIEVHGKQHYENVEIFEDSLEYTTNNDATKKNMALENNISNYIILNFSNTNYEIIEKEIFDNLYMFEVTSEIIKDSIRKSQHSRVVECWRIYNSGVKDTNEISKMLKMSRAVIIKYLKLGARVGAVEYDAQANLGNYNRDSQLEDYLNNTKHIAKLWNDGFSTHDIHIKQKMCRDTVCKYLNKAHELGLCEYKGVHRYKTTKKCSRIIQYDRDMNVINIFESIYDLCEKLNKGKRNMYAKCSNKYVVKSNDEYIFRYENAQS